MPQNEKHKKRTKISKTSVQTINRLHSTKTKIPKRLGHLGGMEQLFQYKSRCDVYANERRLYEKRLIEGWIQRTNRNRRSIRTGL